MKFHFPASRPRVDLRELVRMQKLLVEYSAELSGRAFPCLPCGEIDSEEATRILRDVGIDNATIVGTHTDFRVVPL